MACVVSVPVIITWTLMVINSLVLTGVVPSPTPATGTHKGHVGGKQMTSGQDRVNGTEDSIPEHGQPLGNDTKVHGEQRTSESLTPGAHDYRLPVKWIEFCRITVETYKSRFTQPTLLTVISCHVTEQYSGVWRLDDLRENIQEFLEHSTASDRNTNERVNALDPRRTESDRTSSDRNTNERVNAIDPRRSESDRTESDRNTNERVNATDPQRPESDSIAGNEVHFGIDIHCSSNSNISLTWPMNAQNLFKVVVRNCIIVDYARDFMKIDPEPIPHSLRYMELSNCMEAESYNFTILSLQHGWNSSRDFECGQDSMLETYIYRNITKQLETITKQQLDYLMEVTVQYLQNRKRVLYYCNFKKLLYYEETYNNAKSLYSGALLTDKADYGILDTFNQSHNGISELTDIEHKLHRHFPRLRTLDLSYNDISDIGTFVGPLNQQQTLTTTINLQYNNISTITMKNIRMFQDLSERVLIDIRNNPIGCHCSQPFKDVLDFIQDSQNNTMLKNGSFYSYLKQLACTSPAELKGINLISLSFASLCPEVTSYLIGPIIAISGTCIVLLVTLILLFRFRNEVTVFLFVRLNIVVPWRRRTSDDTSKLYDAFVSYSSREEDWVEEFFEDLEHSTADDNSSHNRQTFKFCMHHRDFTAGKTIFDNVVKSVESSRHTIIILSKHYLDSEFCLYEFQQAFQQSIMEQKRHLVIVMCGEISHEELPRDIKRCIKTFTYIRKDDFMFRSRLVFTLSVEQQERTVTDSTSSRRHWLCCTGRRSSRGTGKDASSQRLLMNGVTTNLIKTSPNHHQTTPNHDQTTPNHVQTIPNHDQTIPNHHQTTPNHDQTIPNHDQTTPNHHQTKPNHDQTIPNHDQTIPNHHQTTPNHDQTIPNHDQTTPNHHQTTPNHDQTIPNHHQTTPNHDQTIPNHHQTTPNHDQTIPNHHQTTPNHDQTIPNHHQTTPNHDQTIPNHHQTTPNHDQTIPNHDQTTPNHHQTIPNHHQTISSNHQTIPNHHQTTPNHVQTIPNHHQTTPNHHQTTTNHHQTIPSCYQTRP